MGAPPRDAAALRLSQAGAKPARRRPDPHQHPRPSGSLALEDRSRSSDGAFLLVPQVRLPKLLDLARDAERALDAVPGLIVANWAEGRLGW